MVQHVHIPDGQPLPVNGAAARPGSSERGFWGKLLVFGLVGAIAPFLVLGLPDRAYVATTVLKVEAASDVDVNAAISRLHSKASLDNLIRALNLGQTGDFSAGRQGVLQVIFDIVSGGGMTVAEAEAELRNRLLNATSMTYVAGQLSIRTTAASDDEAARVASTLATMFGQQLAGVAEAASNPALGGMRQALERAAAALSGFKAQAGESMLAEMQRFSGETQRLVAEKAEAEAELKAIRDKAAQAASMKLADVLGKPLPDSLEFTGLEYQRQRYVEAKLAFDQLAGDLGPLHPRLQAARAAMDAARKDIEDALKRLSASLRLQEGNAAKTLSDAGTRSDALTARRDIAEGASKFTALQAAVDEARDNYLYAQARTGQPPASSETARVHVLEPLATVASGWSWLDYMPLVAAGAFAGGVVGLASNAAASRGLQTQVETAEELGIDPVNRVSEVDLVTEDWPVQGRAREPLTAGTADQAALHGHSRDNDNRDAEALDSETWDSDDWDTEFWDADSRDADAIDDVSRLGEPEPYDDAFGYHDDRVAEMDERPLADRIRELLVANRRPDGAGTVPPLVAAAMAGRGRRDDRTVAEDYRLPHREAHNAEEFRELRRDMVELREKVQTYSERRTASRR